MPIFNKFAFLDSYYLQNESKKALFVFSSFLFILIGLYGRD